jgi:hypothetical protein
MIIFYWPATMNCPGGEILNNLSFYVVRLFLSMMMME